MPPFRSSDTVWSPPLLGNGKSYRVSWLSVNPSTERIQPWHWLAIAPRSDVESPVYRTDSRPYETKNRDEIEPGNGSPIWMLPPVRIDSPREPIVNRDCA